MTSQHTARTAEEYEAEIGLLREKLSDAMACGLQHKSDCAIHNAPAYEPEPCTCGVGAAADDEIFDIVTKVREHNGWQKCLSVGESINLIKSFIARAALASESSS